MFGLTAEVSGLTVDMTNSVSKDAFVASLNLSGATGQTDTKVTAAAAFSSAISGTLDLTILLIMARCDLQFRSMEVLLRKLI